MNSYKKSVLSSVTALLLVSSATASSYLPLTSVDNDNRWVMFGINGFKVDGSKIGSSTTSSKFTDSWGDVGDTRLIDSTKDEVFVSGFHATAGEATTALAELKSLSNKKITLNFNATAETFSPREAIRSMYFKVLPSSSDAGGMLRYKASLEGKKFELQYGDSPETYTVVISAVNTFDKPAV
ncbi:MAG: hypothetical protein U9P38_00110, partial [Campylobacterota bacterium]|nr:hypothetical protein [Campylobacterota bacterium]